MRYRQLPLIGALAALALTPASALAVTTTTSATPSPVTTTTSSTTSVTTSTSSTPAAPPTGRIRLSLLHGIGSPAIALTGHRLGVWGRVRPFAPGLHVTVRFTVDGHRVATRTLAVQDLGNGTGQFEFGYTSSRSGLLVATALHAATSTIGTYTLVAPARIRVVNPDLSFGASGSSVRTLQGGLAALHYAVPQSGVYDDLTDLAVIAYRKMTGEPLVDNTDAHLFEQLENGERHVPRPLPRRRQARRGRPQQAGARRDRPGREGAPHLHHELGQALDADGDRAVPRVPQDAGDQQRGDGRLELLHPRVRDPWV